MRRRDCRLQIFANGKRRFHSFKEFFVIHLKNQEVKIWSQWHFKFRTKDSRETFRRLLLKFISSLIINQVKTKKITTVHEVWIPGLNQHRFWRFYFSVYSLVFVSIENKYQTLETVFYWLSKHLEFRQKYSAARRIFNSLLGVWLSQWNTVSRVWYNTSSRSSDRWTNISG